MRLHLPGSKEVTLVHLLQPHSMDIFGWACALIDVDPEQFLDGDPAAAMHLRASTSSSSSSSKAGPGYGQGAAVAEGGARP